MLVYVLRTDFNVAFRLEGEQALCACVCVDVFLFCLGRGRGCLINLLFPSHFMSCFRCFLVGFIGVLCAFVKRWDIESSQKFSSPALKLMTNF